MKKPALFFFLISILPFLATQPARSATTPEEKVPDGLIPVNVQWAEARGERAFKVTPVEEGDPLMLPNGRAVIEPRGCTVEKRLEPKPGGFNLVLTVSNDTDEPRLRPRVHFPGIRLKPKVMALDPRQVGHMEPRDGAGKSSMPGRPFVYGDAYSPVVLVHDDRFAVGVSLIYDILEAKHTVSMGWRMEGGAWWGQFHATFDLSGRKMKDAIAPGESADYRLAVRFAEPDTPRKALEPYKTFFRKKYGKVRYTADRRPVMALALSMDAFLNDDNPRGFGAQNRMDLIGWRKTVDTLLDLGVENGYRRSMLWRASGVYSKGHNFPVEFMTGWPEKLVETVGELDRLRDKGMDIGLWWGHASHVSAGWNSGKMWTRDIDKKSDVQAAWAELDLAKKYGIDEVGLDAFSAIPVWDRYRFMKTMQTRYPDIEFTTEPADVDFMHTLAPTFCWYHKQQGRATLADWLNPGHETWMFMQARQVNVEWFKNSIEWGLTPVTMWKPVKHRVTEQGEVEVLE